MTIPTGQPVHAPALLPPQRTSAPTELATGLRGELALPGSPGYERLTSPFNVSVVQRPVAVAAVADAYDVAHVVRTAGRAGLRVAVQCTGHGAGPALHDTVLVDTAALQECEVHPPTATSPGWARVGAGVRWHALLEAAAPLGLTGLAGSSSGVGVVGYTSGGGLGPLARTFGAASDTVRAIDVVTGSGRLVRATPDEHADLFWALRGGKGVAGIVTAIELDLLPLTRVHAGALHFAGEDAAQVLHAWRQWAPSLPATATTSLAVRRLPPLPDVPPALAGRTTVAVRLASTAPEHEAAALLDPLRAVATPVLGGVGELPATELDPVHGDPTSPMPSQDRAGLLRELSAATVEVLLAQVGPGAGSPLGIVELRQLDGALSRPGSVPGAFSTRGAAYSVQAIGLRTPDTAEAVAAAADRLLTALAPWCTPGRLPNTGHEQPPGHDAATLARLRDVVHAHDPEGVLLEADSLA